MKHSLMMAMLLGLVSVSCSHKKDQPKEYEVMSKTISDSAKVSNVDYKKKLITLATDDGPVTIAAGEVKNLDSIKKGDTVVAEYKEALVYSIVKEDAKEYPTYSSDTWSAKPGETPAAGAKAQVSTSVVITDIDRKEPSVTLANDAGEKETFKVAHPERLKGVHVGDIVNIKYSQAMAVKVEKTNSASY